jgi:hypothetical protein
MDDSAWHRGGEHEAATELRRKDVAVPHAAWFVLPHREENEQGS